MKRYLLFAFDGYYPEGGWSDYRGDYDTLREAEVAGSELRYNYWHVIDTALLPEGADRMVSYGKGTR